MAEASEWAHYHSQPIFDARGDLYFSRSGWDYRGHSGHVSRWEGDGYGTPDSSGVWLALRDRVEPGRHLYEVTPGYDGSFALLVVGERPRQRPARPARSPGVVPVGHRVDGAETAPGRSQHAPDGDFAFYSPGGRELYFVRDFAGFHHLPLALALGPR
jgi:hypothetical protein